MISSAPSESQYILLAVIEGTGMQEITLASVTLVSITLAKSGHVLNPESQQEHTTKSISTGKGEEWGQ